MLSDEDSTPHLKLDCPENEPMLKHSDEHLVNNDVNNIQNIYSLSNRKDNQLSRNKIFILIAKIVSICFFMYIFICSLDLMNIGFRLFGGKNANKFLSHNEMLSNPIVGLMIGILVTVLVQSSSTSTSIIVTMISSEIISVRYAIPIVMGANVGTSITNTIVSFVQSGDREEFRRAFAAATIHDIFNWLSVFVLLTLELCIHFLEYSTDYILMNFNFEDYNKTRIENKTLLIKKITNFFTETIIKIDNKLLENIHFNNDSSVENKSILIKCCDTVPKSYWKNNSECLTKCTSIFNYFGFSDWITGTCVLILSILLLCLCLLLVVKVLHSLISGKIPFIIKNYINAEYKFPWSYLIGYLAIFIGCIITIVVQSSSIFTSTLTPLAGFDIISIEQIYPLTLGSNIGTTTTGIFAALASQPNKLKESLQIAFCHLLFNITGILLFYPIPMLRFPITIAKLLGKVTSQYRWFAIFYLLFFFLFLPLIIFILSLAGKTIFTLIILPIILLLLGIIIINILQSKFPVLLPVKLQNWNFLPIWLHSLDPYDCALINLANKIPFILNCLKTEYKHDQTFTKIMSCNTNSQLHILNVSRNNSTIDIDFVDKFKTQNETNTNIEMTENVCYSNKNKN